MTFKLGKFTFDLSQETLGRGTFGVVYLGKNENTEQQVAVKQCEIRKDTDGELAIQELKHFTHLRKHPHIVELLDCFFKKKSFWMVLQYCNGGNLKNFMCANNPDFTLKLNFMYQCASAINFMHSLPKYVVHRDIKPSNILIMIQDNGPVVKITDFGLSKLVDAPNPATTYLFHSKCGTPGFMAPEFFLKSTDVNYSRPVDIFSLGLVFAAILQFKAQDKDVVPVIGLYRNFASHFTVISRAIAPYYTSILKCALRSNYCM